MEKNVKYLVIILYIIYENVYVIINWKKKTDSNFFSFTFIIDDGNIF